MQIGRGTLDGVRKGQLVVGLEGLLGIVDSCGDRTSSVMLMTHPDFSLACKIPARNVTGLLRGRMLRESAGPDLLLPTQSVVVDKLYGTLFDQVQEGDQVFTSSGGGATDVTDGILVGAVTDMANDELGAPRLQVQPIEYLPQLRYVLVVLTAPSDQALKARLSTEGQP
jgi:cell shape-determining protein MreC